MSCTNTQNDKSLQTLRDEWGWVPAGYAAAMQNVFDRMYHAGQIGIPGMIAGTLKCAVIGNATNFINIAIGIQNNNPGMTGREAAKAAGGVLGGALGGAIAARGGPGTVALAVVLFGQGGSDLGNLAWEILTNPTSGYALNPVDGKWYEIPPAPALGQFAWERPASPEKQQELDGAMRQKLNSAQNCIAPDGDPAINNSINGVGVIFR